MWPRSTKPGTAGSLRGPTGHTGGSANLAPRVGNPASAPTRQRSGHRREGNVQFGRRVGSWKLRPLRFLLILSLLPARARSLEAATNRHSSPTSLVSGVSAFCENAATFGRTTTDLFSLRPQALEQIFDTKFKTAQPVMLSLAPSPIRSDLRKIFAFDNRLFVEPLRGRPGPWRFLQDLLEDMGGRRLQLRPAAAKVIRYLDATCGFKLTKP